MAFKTPVNILIYSVSAELKSPNGCSNDSVSLFKVMLKWLAMCSIKDSCFKTIFLPYLKHVKSMHVSVLRQKYNVSDL